MEYLNHIIRDTLKYEVNWSCLENIHLFLLENMTKILIKSMIFSQLVTDVAGITQGSLFGPFMMLKRCDFQARRSFDEVKRALFTF